MSAWVGSRRGYELERAGIFNRLVDEEQLGLIDAEDWLRTWEAKAESIGRPQETHDFWVEGWRWITGELGFQRRNAQ